MTTNTLAIRVMRADGSGAALVADARGLGWLALLLGLNLAAVTAVFALEDRFWPWCRRMETMTPGWCFVLAQAAVLGFVTVVAIRGKWVAVAYGLLSATLLGYAYCFAGRWNIASFRDLESSQLVFRSVVLGLVTVAAVVLGMCIRLMLRQRLRMAEAIPHERRMQHSVRDLLFLMAVFAVGLGSINLFLDHFDREMQIWQIVVAVAVTFPAVLPWLWGATQRRLTAASISAIVLASLALIGIKSFVIYGMTGQELSEVILQAEYRAAAFTFAGILNGLLLRVAGFSWGQD